MFYEFNKKLSKVHDYLGKHEWLSIECTASLVYCKTCGKIMYDNNMLNFRSFQGSRYEELDDSWSNDSVIKERYPEISEWVAHFLRAKG